VLLLFCFVGGDRGACLFVFLFPSLALLVLGLVNKFVCCFKKKKLLRNLQWKWEYMIEMILTFKVLSDKFTMVMVACFLYEEYL
jgi:hypothetical protein